MAEGHWNRGCLLRILTFSAKKKKKKKVVAMRIAAEDITIDSDGILEGWTWCMHAADSWDITYM